ncbi:DMT family transporter [Bacterioplanes sanyensis]|uniref:DMT family transporter n=1 Tax=Bacterioplanes sanyensis TaxID=1249553 RepID=UPI0012FD76EE|nr:DMT family transporter [Bacterioplanes sanyensis]
MSVLIALLSACAWSLFDVKRKQLVQQVAPLPLTFWLSLSVIPFYLVLSGVALALSPDASLPASGYWWPALGSLLVSTMAAVSFVQALKVGQMAGLMPVLALTPVISALLSVWWLADELSARQWGAMSAIVVLLFWLQGGARFRWQAGTGFMLLVALGWGTGTVFDKCALAYAEPLQHALLQSSGMMLLVALVIFVRGERQQLSFHRLPLFALMTAALVFIVAVSAQLFALQSLHAGIIETIKRSIGIVGGLFWGAYLFGETVSRQQQRLVALLVAAIAWLMWPV